MVNGLRFSYSVGSSQAEVVTREEYLRREKEESKNATVLGGIVFRPRTTILDSAVLSMFEELKLPFAPIINPLQDSWFLGSQTLENKLEPRNLAQKLPVLPQLIGKLSGLMVYIPELMRGPIKASVYSCLRKN